MGLVDAFKTMMSGGTPTDYKALVSQNAQIIDVRSPDEFSGGHVRGSVNIPLPDLERQLSKIKKERPVITCCASGMRSGSAKRILESKGYENVHNGGGWAALQAQL